MSRVGELMEVYMRATYYVEVGNGEVIRLKIGQASPPLTELLRHCNATSWAFITAANPGSVPLSPGENDQRYAELLAMLTQQKYRLFAGEGIDETGAWTPERSLLILDIERESACQIGRKFGQIAIVYGQRDSPPELLLCDRDGSA